ncbi:capsid protein, partial [bacterium]|nr:capsid protein [bacterium]
EGYNPQAEAAEYLTELMAVDREKRVADIAFNAGSYATGCKTTLTGENQFSHANSDPLNTLLTGLDAPFVRPNTIVMGQAVWSALRRNAKMVQTVYPNANGNGIITPEQLAGILGVDRVLIGQARANRAKRGAAPNIDYLWGKHLAMLYIDASATVSSRLTWGFTAEFGSRSSGVIPAPEKSVRGSVRVRVSESLRELVVCPDAGYFIQNAVS